MPQFSEEQKKIINAPIAPISVIACAGSGKTFTAVRRLAQVRQQIDDKHSRVALLSFSNIAVDTFRYEYQKLIQRSPKNGVQSRVEINTLDAFITSNVLHPHAYRTMGAQQAAFLVKGVEAFLNNFTFMHPSKKYPCKTTQMGVHIDRSVTSFYFEEHNDKTPLDTKQAKQAIEKLGKTGGYTYSLGRYWCHRTLADQPNILRALVRRYPHILIDEAQDIGTVHQAIIEQLISAGCKVSLIGDPNQGIYEFAGANGKFLTSYGQREDVQSLCLTKNFRSVPTILSVANKLSARTDTADRIAPDTRSGAFFVSYQANGEEDLITRFKVEVLAAGLKLENSAVLCRSNSMVSKLSGKKDPPGQGTVKNLVQAAILRDQHQDYLGAFELVASSIVNLLDNPPKGLVERITQTARYPKDRILKRLVWAFTRNADSGLPPATLNGKMEWHQQLMKRINVLLERVKIEHDLNSINRLSNKLANKELPNAPLIISTGLEANQNVVGIRIDTVHQVKGESLDAVLYLTNHEQANALLAGVDTEVGRIGYVAVTRARNLLWIGIQETSLKKLSSNLIEKGFQNQEQPKL